MDLVPRLVGILEIDRVDLEQREIALALLGAANVAIDRIAGAQVEAPDLARTDIDIFRPWQKIRIGRAQKTQAIPENFHDAFADDADIAHRQALQNGIDELLAPERAGILDFELLGDAEHLGWRFLLEVVEFDFLEFCNACHGGCFGNAGPGAWSATARPVLTVATRPWMGRE